MPSTPLCLIFILMDYIQIYISRKIFYLINAWYVVCYISFFILFIYYHNFILLLVFFLAEGWGWGLLD